MQQETAGAQGAMPAGAGARAKAAAKMALKLVVTVGFFYLLLAHQVRGESGAPQSVLALLRGHLGTLAWEALWPFLLAALATKAVGIACAMLRWHLLLRGQGIAFNFGHIVGSFLIGRFLGTFLPSTVGLDGYKLYDAARFSRRVVQPAAALAVEKFMGISAIFLTFLVSLPWGAGLLGEARGSVVAVAGPVAAVWVIGFLVLLLRPAWWHAAAAHLTAKGPGRWRAALQRFWAAAAAYQGRTALLLAVLGLSFVVHFSTAVMYFFTALAVGAVAAPFWEVMLASAVQIFATVISPFTIAGEGVRELVQALLLAKRIGFSASVLSAALGFWAAEAMTCVGILFWWSRRRGYRPKRVSIDGVVLVA